MKRKTIIAKIHAEKKASRDVPKTSKYAEKKRAQAEGKRPSPVFEYR